MDLFNPMNLPGSQSEKAKQDLLMDMPNAPEDDEIGFNTKNWLIHQYADRMASVRELLRVWMQWYTFFWTLNLAALAFLLEKKAGYALTIAILFVFLNGLGTVVCLATGLHINGFVKDAVVFAQNLKGSYGTPFSQFFVKAVFGMASSTLLANIGCWVYLFIYPLA